MNNQISCIPWKFTFCNIDTVHTNKWVIIHVFENLDFNPGFADSTDPDHLASEEASWSESALFVIPFVNLCHQPGSSNLTGGKLEVDAASYFIQHGKGWIGHAELNISLIFDRK